MLQTILIGNIGADAEKQSKDGRIFITFRVAHNEQWTDATGNKQSRIQWVDCIINGEPRVYEYLKKGTQVYIIGDLSTRIYSSAKDRCMKAGLTIHVRHIELLGGRTDDVPRRLYDANGVIHDINKAYYTDVANTVLMDTRSNQYVVDKNRFITPSTPQAPNTTQDATTTQANVNTNINTAAPF